MMIVLQAFVKLDTVGISISHLHKICKRHFFTWAHDLCKVHGHWLEYVGKVFSVSVNVFEFCYCFNLGSNSPIIVCKAPMFAYKALIFDNTHQYLSLSHQVLTISQLFCLLNLT